MLHRPPRRCTPRPLRRPLAGARRRWRGLPGNLRGAVWVLVSATAFAGMGATIKSLGSTLHVFEIAFFRALFGAVVLLPFVLRTGLREVLVPNRPDLVIARAFVGTTAMACLFYSFTALPLASATAIAFSRPLFLVILAVLFLGELVRWRRWLATAVGFGGVVIMLRPGSETLDPGALAGLAGALLVATAMMLIKKLTASDRPLTVMALFALPASVGMAIPAALVWQTPDGSELARLILVGVLATMGQYCAVRGFRVGEATAVVPFDYLQLPLAGILGWVLFTELPDVWTVVGALVIAGATLYIMLREARVKQAPPPPDPVR